MCRNAGRSASDRVKGKRFSFCSASDTDVRSAGSSNFFARVPGSRQRPDSRSSGFTLPVRIQSCASAFVSALTSWPSLTSTVFTRPGIGQSSALAAPESFFFGMRAASSASRCV